MLLIVLYWGTDMRKNLLNRLAQANGQNAMICREAADVIKVERNLRRDMLEAIQSKLSLALQVDLEQGVRVLNEQVSKEFAEKYPTLIQALNEVQDMEA